MTENKRLRGLSRRLVLSELFSPRFKFFCFIQARDPVLNTHIFGLVCVFESNVLSEKLTSTSPQQPQAVMYLSVAVVTKGAQTWF